MSMSLETKACNACAAAKKKCGRQRPCLRCTKRDIECKYPPSKPSQFVLCEEEKTDIIRESAVVPCNAPQPSDSAQIPLAGGSKHLDFSTWPDLPNLASRVDITQSVSRWFTSLETWKVFQLSKTEIERQCLVIDMKRFVMTIRRWLTQWVERGSNPFIHSQLYRTRLPSCIQNAYMAFSIYNHKTSVNEHVVHRIIDDRAKELVSQYDCPPIGLMPQKLDLLDHIARVQALLLYQVIGLYDGDIRLRHLAESHIPVLNSWMRQMAQQASQGASLGSLLVPSGQGGAGTNTGLAELSDCQNLLWYSWIVAETVRRTWVVASGIQGLYLMIQRGKISPCQGGMMFTTRRGVWEAQSAFEWEKLCSEKNVGLMQISETAKLFTVVGPNEVNDFTRMVLEVTTGVERMARWGVDFEG